MDRILFGQEDGDSFSFLFLRKADMEGIVKNPCLLGLYFFQEWDLFFQSMKWRRENSYSLGPGWKKFLGHPEEGWKL